MYTYTPSKYGTYLHGWSKGKWTKTTRGPSPVKSPSQFLIPARLHPDICIIMKKMFTDDLNTDSHNRARKKIPFLEQN